MYRSWKKALIVSLAGAFFGMMPVVSAMPPIMPIGEVQEGMSGTGYTVVDESGEIRPFHVDIVGVLDNGKTATPLIMAKASGDLVDDTVGVLQGMSGSPVYVDGKLVGALSAGLKGMTPFTFFITPIEDMMELWKMPDTKNKTQISTVDIKKAAEEREKDAAGEDGGILGKIQAAFVSALDEIENAKEQKVPEEKDAPELEEKATWCLSGFDEASRSFLRQHVFSEDSLALQPLNTTYLSKERGTDYHASLEPGSMMGVALAYGDFSIGATGTVTAVDGRRILGFGHSFLHRGNVNYFLTDASVVGTVSSASDSGTKLSNMGDIIGRVNQDRETGVAGELGVFPAVVPMKVTVREHDLGREQSYTTRIAYDEDLLAQISAAMAYASLSKTTDSLGESTVQVHFAIRTDVAENGKAERSNMFYNTTDVGQIAVLEFAQAVNIICSNEEKESELLDIQMDIDVNNGRKTATIVSAVPDKTEVKPGETVNFTTTIKPYRQEKMTLTIPYKVPKTQLPGTLHLDVRGGGLVPVTQLLGLQQGLATTGTASGATEEAKGLSTSEKLKNLLSTSRNNEIVIAPGASQTVMSEQEQKKAIREAARASANAAQEHTVNLLGSDKENASRETKFETDYIIENAIHTTLQVKK